MAISTFIHEKERRYREAMLGQQQAMSAQSQLGGLSGLLSYYDRLEVKSQKIETVKEKSFREELQSEIDDWLT